MTLFEEEISVPRVADERTPRVPRLFGEAETSAVGGHGVGDEGVGEADDRGTGARSVRLLVRALSSGSRGSSWLIRRSTPANFARPTRIPGPDLGSKPVLHPRSRTPRVTHPARRRR